MAQCLAIVQILVCKHTVWWTLFIADNRNILFYDPELSLIHSNPKELSHV